MLPLIFRKVLALGLMSYGALCLYMLATINDQPDLEYFLFFTAGVSVIIGLFALNQKD